MIRADPVSVASFGSMAMGAKQSVAIVGFNKGMAWFFSDGIVIRSISTIPETPHTLHCPFV